MYGAVLPSYNKKDTDKKEEITLMDKPENKGMLTDFINKFK